MSEWVQVILAALMVLLLLSPLYVPVVCFAVQVFLSEHCPPLLLLLPVVTGALVFGWFPSNRNELFRVFYCLDMFGALVGSILGAIVCTAANWKMWFKR